MPDIRLLTRAALAVLAELDIFTYYFGKRSMECGARTLLIPPRMGVLNASGKYDGCPLPDDSVWKPRERRYTHKPWP
jgi:hypothetical protein